MIKNLFSQQGRYNRAGFFNQQLERIASMTTCPKHRRDLTTITDLYQYSLSFQRFLRNMIANISLLVLLSKIYCTNVNQILELTDEFLQAMDKNLFTGAVMIEFRKVFDVVDNELPLKKLQVYGLSTNSLKWFQSYLSGRCQKVFQCQR